MGERCAAGRCENPNSFDTGRGRCGEEGRRFDRRVGENESTNREAWSEDHRGDRDSLELLGAQNDLVKAVVETGKPVVVLLLNGRPLSVNYIAEKVPAILEGFYLARKAEQRRPT